MYYLLYILWYHANTLSVKSVENLKVNKISGEIERVLNPTIFMLGYSFLHS